MNRLKEAKARANEATTAAAAAAAKATMTREYVEPKNRPDSAETLRVAQSRAANDAAMVKQQALAAKRARKVAMGEAERANRRQMPAAASRIAAVRRGQLARRELGGFGSSAALIQLRWRRGRPLRRALKRAELERSALISEHLWACWERREAWLKGKSELAAAAARSAGSAIAARSLAALARQHAESAVELSESPSGAELLDEAEIVNGAGMRLGKDRQRVLLNVVRQGRGLSKHAATLLLMKAQMAEAMAEAEVRLAEAERAVKSIDRDASGTVDAAEIEDAALSEQQKHVLFEALYRAADAAKAAAEAAPVDNEVTINGVKYLGTDKSDAAARRQASAIEGSTKAVRWAHSSTEGELSCAGARDILTKVAFEGSTLLCFGRISSSAKAEQLRALCTGPWAPTLELTEAVDAHEAAQNAAMMEDFMEAVTECEDFEWQPWRREQLETARAQAVVCIERRTDASWRPAYSAVQKLDEALGLLPRKPLRWRGSKIERYERSVEPDEGVAALRAELELMRDAAVDVDARSQTEALREAAKEALADGRFEAAAVAAEHALAVLLELERSLEARQGRSTPESPFKPPAAAEGDGARPLTPELKERSAERELLLWPPPIPALEELRAEFEALVLPAQMVKLFPGIVADPTLFPPWLGGATLDSSRLRRGAGPRGVPSMEADASPWESFVAPSPRMDEALATERQSSEHVRERQLRELKQLYTDDEARKAERLSFDEFAARNHAQSPSAAVEGWWLAMGAPPGVSSHGALRYTELLPTDEWIYDEESRPSLGFTERTKASAKAFENAEDYDHEALGKMSLFEALLTTRAASWRQQHCAVRGEHLEIGQEGESGFRVLRLSECELQPAAFAHSGVATYGFFVRSFASALLRDGSDSDSGARELSAVHCFCVGTSNLAGVAGKSARLADLKLGGVALLQRWLKDMARALEPSRLGISAPALRRWLSERPECASLSLEELCRPPPKQRGKVKVVSTASEKRQERAAGQIWRETASMRCAAVELFRPQPNALAPASVYVSHSDSLTLEELVQALEAHSAAAKDGCGRGRGRGRGAEEGGQLGLEPSYFVPAFCESLFLVLPVNVRNGRLLERGLAQCAAFEGQPPSMLQLIGCASSNRDSTQIGLSVPVQVRCKCAVDLRVSEAEPTYCSCGALAGGAERWERATAALLADCGCLLRMHKAVASRAELSVAMSTQAAEAWLSARGANLARSPLCEDEAQQWVGWNGLDHLQFGQGRLARAIDVARAVKSARVSGSSGSDAVQTADALKRLAARLPQFANERWGHGRATLWMDGMEGAPLVEAKVGWALERALFLA